MFNLKGFRKVNNLTQRGAAEYFDCDQGFISQMENGKRPVPYEYVEKIKADKIYKLPNPIEIQTTKTNQSMYTQEDLLNENAILREELERYKRIVDSLTMKNDELLNKQTGSD